MQGLLGAGFTSCMNWSFHEMGLGVAERRLQPWPRGACYRHLVVVVAIGSFGIGLCLWRAWAGMWNGK